MLPNFIIAGAAKSGTTSLYHYLGQHPDICMSSLKETNFFAVDDPFVLENWDNYPFLVKSQQDYEALFESEKNCHFCGEASPIYLESKLAAERIKRLIPGCRIIILLRNPVKRAFSGYLMHVRYNNESQVDVDNIGPADFSGDKRFVRSGFYHENVQRYLDVFGPDQVKIYIFEEFIADIAGHMRDCCDFIGVDNRFEFELKEKFNAGQFPKSVGLNRFLMNDFMRNKVSRFVPKSIVRAGKNLWKSNQGKAPKMPQRIHSYLAATYAEDVAALEKLLGRDLSLWNPQGDSRG